MSKLTVNLPGHPPVTHALGDGPVVIGRSVHSDLQVLHTLVSKRHAVIERRGGETHLRDLDSHNGTFVNNQRIREAVLRDGDVVRLAVVDCTFEFSPEQVPAAPKPAALKTPTPSQSISTKDLPLAAPEDLESLEPPPAPGPARPVEEPVAVKSAGPSVTAPAAPPASRRTPLPRATKDLLAAPKTPLPAAAPQTAPVPPANPDFAPSRAVESRCPPGFSSRWASAWPPAPQRACGSG
jgi:hypothetical protein